MATKAERQQANQNRLKAMSHPLRAKCLLILVEKAGLVSPAEMARELGIPIGNVSYHVKKLVELDCAELVEERPVRGAVEHFYRATDRHLIDTEEWDDVPEELREGLLVEFMQPIVDDFTASARAQMVGSDERFHITRTPLVMDRQGLEELMEIHERARLEVLEAQRRSAGRRADSGSDAIHVSSSQCLFEIPAP